MAGLAGNSFTIAPSARRTTRTLPPSASANSWPSAESDAFWLPRTGAVVAHTGETTLSSVFQTRSKSPPVPANTTAAPSADTATGPVFPSIAVDTIEPSATRTR